VRLHTTEARCTALAVCELPFPFFSLITKSAEDSDIYEWDVTTKRCRQKFKDQGAHSPTCIALSPSGKYLVTGFVV
jgi:WD40 repeat protein